MAALQFLRKSISDCESERQVMSRRDGAPCGGVAIDGSHGDRLKRHNAILDCLFVLCIAACCGPMKEACRVIKKSADIFILTSRALRIRSFFWHRILMCVRLYAPLDTNISRNKNVGWALVAQGLKVIKFSNQEECKNQRKCSKNRRKSISQYVLK